MPPLLRRLLTAVGLAAALVAAAAATLRNRPPAPAPGAWQPLDG